MGGVFVRKVKRKNGAVSVRIVEGRRHGKRVVQRVVKTVGQSGCPEGVALLERSAREEILRLKKNGPAPGEGGRRCEVPPHVKLRHARGRGRINFGIFNVFGRIYDEMGLGGLVESTYKNGQWNDILKALVLGRIAEPESKKRTARTLSEHFLVDYPLEKFYRAMDRAVRFEDKAKGIVLKETLRYGGGTPGVILFDVTTLYFESTEADDLRAFGFSKDNKFKEVQVVLSLITTGEGYPVGYKLFPGNISEGRTLVSHLEDIRKRFDLRSTTLIADRAMFTEENLKDMEKRGIRYVVACKLRSLPKEKKERILTDDDFAACTVGGDLHWTKEYGHGGRRLIVGYSSSRASRDARMRERLVERLLNKSKCGKIKASDAVGNAGNRRFIGLRGKTLEIDQNKVAEEARWDGLHGVVTNDARHVPSTILSLYRRLWRIEEAFRFNKHDLRMRPVYHWKPERVRAHILICYLAFAVGRFTMERINRGRGEAISFGECVRELADMEGLVVANGGDPKDGSLYVIPPTPTDGQRDIFAALGIAHHARPFRL